MSRLEYEDLEITIFSITTADVVTASPIGGGNVDIGFDDEVETEIDIFSMDDISWTSLD